MLVYGDTNSTLAGALAASKMHIPVAHVEAGLRSLNMAMPEEINRILTDRVSTILFCPTDVAVENLQNEGFPFNNPNKGKQQICNVGDVMFDATLYYREKARKSVSLETWGLEEKNYGLCTIHRAENTDDENRLISICKALNQINSFLPIILPLHPRTKNILKSLGQLALLSDVKLVDPLTYMETQRIEMGASIILTDSGGMQKEAFFHKVPRITLRDETEWVETVELGWNRVIGAEENVILSTYDMVKKEKLDNSDAKPYGDGDSANKIVKNY